MNLVEPVYLRLASLSQALCFFTPRLSLLLRAANPPLPPPCFQCSHSSFLSPSLPLGKFRESELCSRPSAIIHWSAILLILHSTPPLTSAISTSSENRTKTTSHLPNILWPPRPGEVRDASRKAATIEDKTSRQTDKNWA